MHVFSKLGWGFSLAPAKGERGGVRGHGSRVRGDVRITTTMGNTAKPVSIA
jgi:hypothetical protein